MFLCTNMHNFTLNTNISLQMPIFPGKELPQFPTFSHCVGNNFQYVTLVYAGFHATEVQNDKIR